MVRQVLRYLSLRPYGDSLLTPAGAFWVFAVRIAILLMASAEALAWSYAAFYLATGGLRWAAGAGAFAFTFTTVWLIDTSLMALDRWARKHDYRVTSEPRSTWANHGWDVLSIGTRVALVALSMYITAPFLAQLMFNDDIERALRNERTALRATTRQSILVPLEKRLALLRLQLDERRAGLDAEVAGAGPSRKYGDGVAARQLRATIAAIEAERAALTAEHVRAATEFDGLSDRAMTERYKLAPPGDSFQERARALANIKNESYRLTERAVQAFLAFLFFALLLLKLFEPRSVRVYFSERLQGLYRQYVGGLFDPHLDPAERSLGSAPMTALRFEDWCLHTYPAIRARTVDTIKAGERAQFFGNSVTELGGIIAAIAAEEAALNAELASIESQRQHAIADRVAAERSLASADERVAEIRAQRATLEAALKRPAPAHSVAAILSTLSELEEPAAQAATQRAAAYQRLDAVTPVVADVEKRCAEHTTRVEKMARTRQQAEAELTAVRLRHMAELNRALTTRWPDAAEAKPALTASESGVPERVM